jgi:hypothetical protein
MPTLLERINSLCGPGVLAGIALGDWLKLLLQNHFRVHPKYLPRALNISAWSLVNSFVRAYEQWRYGKQFEQIEIPPPLFVLGHWRSGTTFLHDLLSLDNRFAYPTLYQVMFPHGFLTTERLAARLMRPLMPPHRPQDNMKLDPSAAWEDENVMCAWGFRTPYLGWALPHRQTHYDQFLTFAHASPDDLAQWKTYFRLYLKKLTLNHGKPLILKSPPHTARIKLLLDLFPDAKFVHICRDPYTVFQSSVHSFKKVMPTCRLQPTDAIDWDERVLNLYRHLYDAFFEQRHLIPHGNYHELRFEELEADPIAEMRKLYDSLNLPPFERVEPDLKRYVDSIKTYKKNVFRELSPELRERIGKHWRRSFEEWGYSLNVRSPATVR